MRTLRSSPHRCHIFVGALVLLGSCGPSQTLPADALAPVPVGVVMPLSGDNGRNGPDRVKAIQLAVREINAAGGVLPGRRIQLFVEDSESTPEGARAAATRLVEEHGVVGIIGESGSSSSIAVYEVTAPARVPQISCCSTSTRLTDLVAAQMPEDRFFFRTSPPDDRQAAALIDVLAGEAACESPAVLHVNDAYGTALVEALEASSEARGVSFAAVVPFAAGQARYDDEIAQIAMASPAVDCIVLVSLPQSAGIIVRTWRDFAGAPPIRWIGTDGLRSSAFVSEIVDPAAIDGFLGTAPQTDDPTDPANAAFRRRFRAAFGESSISFLPNSFDAAALLALGIAGAGSTDGDAIRDAIRELGSTEGSFYRPGELSRAMEALREGEPVDYEGASGGVDVDELGNVISDYVVWRFRASDSSFETVRTIRAESL